MITISTRRHNGAWHSFEPREVTLDRALVSLLKFELGFGGIPERVVDGEDELHLVIKTHLMGTMDLVTFAGSANDMRVLMEATFAWASVVKHPIDEAIRSNALKSLASEDGSYIPLMVTTAGPVLIGEQRTRAAVLLLLFGRLSEEQLAASMELVKSAQQFSMEDLCAVLALAHETDTPRVDVLREMMS